VQRIHERQSAEPGYASSGRHRWRLPGRTVTGTGRLLYRADRRTQSGLTVQAAAGGEPREVSLVAVKLESVGLHPFRDSAGALAHSGQKRVNVANRNRKLACRPRRGEATDHNVRRGTQGPLFTWWTLSVQEPTPVVHSTSDKQSMTAQDHAACTAYGRPDKTGTSQVRHHQCQNSSATAGVRCHGRPCRKRRRDLVTPAPRSRHGRRLAGCLTSLVGWRRVCKNQKVYEPLQPLVYDSSVRSIFIFIQFTAIKSNQKQHNDKKQYNWGATRL